MQFRRHPALVRITTLLAALPLLAGSCTAGRIAPGGQATGGGEVQQQLAAIPFPADAAAPRAASVETHAQIAGTAEWQHGPGSFDVGLPIPGHSLPAPAGELRWAIYRMPDHDYPVLRFYVGLSILYGEAYVGVANHAKGQWDFYGPETGGSYTHSLSTHHVSPAGYVYVAVAAFDNANVTVTSFSLVTDEPGWHRTVIAEGTGYQYLQLFADGPEGLPQLAALSGAVLRYYSTATAAPAGPGSWEMVNAHLPAVAGTLRFPLRAECINGKPAMAYFEGDGPYDLMYSYALVAEPGAGDWATVAIDSVTTPDNGLGFCEFERKPRIAFKDAYADDLQLATANTATPLAADWHVYGLAANGTRPSLALVNGRLACAFMTNGVDFLLRYTRALVDEPDGMADWSTPTSFGPLPGNYSMMTDLAAIPLGAGQAPAIAFVGQGEGPQIHCANKTEPETVVDWYRSYLDSSRKTGNYKFEISEIDGRPAVAYYLDDVSWLRFAWASVPQPENSGDWVIETIEAGREIGAVSLASVNDKPAIAYYDIGDDAIKYAYPD